MQARLSAVQRTLIVVTIVALGIAAIVLPAPDNADYRRTLAELTSLQRRFDRASVEAALLEHAKAQARQPLAHLTQQISALRPIAVQAAAQAPAVEPIAALKIATLADIDRYAQPGATLPMRVAELSTVASSLAWRLTREAPKDTPVTLSSAQLRAAAVEPAAVELEAQIAGLQNDQQAARAAAERASAQLTSITTLYENRIKWRVSRQLRNDTYKTLLEARKTQRDAERALRDVDKRYEAAVVKAAPAAKSKTAAANEDLGVLDVDLSWSSTTKHYEIPVRVKTVQAPLPPLQGVALRQTHAAGLWDEVKDLDAAGAARTVVQRFNWHQQHIDVAGMQLGGGAVLQLMPCILPLLLLFLLGRMRAVALDYNPFRTRVRTALPRVGFRTRLLDALAIVVLPLVAAVLAVSSLMIIGQIPALPVLAAVASLVLGAYAFVKLGELQRLMEDVVRSHSVPPPEEQPAST
jgi:hypothetical protein